MYAYVDVIHRPAGKRTSNVLASSRTASKRVRSSAERLRTACASAAASRLFPGNGGAITGHTVPGSGSVPLRKYCRTYFCVQTEGPEREQCYVVAGKLYICGNRTDTYPG
jgi:hypothetical protein